MFVVEGGNSIVRNKSAGKQQDIASMWHSANAICMTATEQNCIRHVRFCLDSHVLKGAQCGFGGVIVSSMSRLTSHRRLYGVIYLLEYVYVVMIVFCCSLIMIQ